MRKRVLMVVLVLLIAMTASVYAASTGGIEFLNYASWYDIDSETGSYVPGLRGEFFFSDYLGVSADALLLAEGEDNYGNPEYLMMYILDVVLRLPLGLIEPYAGLGPVYFGWITEADSGTTDTVGFNVRGGVDFNIFDWLSFGVEANYFVDSFEEFFNNTDYYFSEAGFKQSALIGVSAKFKF